MMCKQKNLMYDGIVTITVKGISINQISNFKRLCDNFLNMDTIVSCDGDKVTIIGGK